MNMSTFAIKVTILLLTQANIICLTFVELMIQWPELMGYWEKSQYWILGDNEVLINFRDIRVTFDLCEIIHFFNNNIFYV